jgi:hypothetical protein
MVDLRGCFWGLQVLVRKHEGKRSLAKTKHRCEGNIETNFEEIVLDEVDWIYLTKDSDRWRALVKVVTNF